MPARSLRLQAAMTGVFRLRPTTPQRSETDVRVPSQARCRRRGVGPGNAAPHSFSRRTMPSPTAARLSSHYGRRNTARLLVTRALGYIREPRHVLLPPGWTRRVDIRAGGGLPHLRPIAKSMRPSISTRLFDDAGISAFSSSPHDAFLAFLCRKGAGVEHEGDVDGCWMTSAEHTCAR